MCEVHGEASPILLEAALSDDLAACLEETPLSKDQRIERTEQGNTLHATVRNTWQLRMWLLSQGAGVMVREPADLREEMAATLREATRQNDGQAEGEVRA